MRQDAYCPVLNLILQEGSQKSGIAGRKYPAHRDDRTRFPDGAQGVSCVPRREDYVLQGLAAVGFRLLTDAENVLGLRVGQLGSAYGPTVTDE